ncbi:hypothetical protein NA57DRAFT_47393 [Rhizodiscina lignyota]|uniref:Fungal N-terminal domain-containing protein n=1 Tax=Rhizodiscina lignyota TaxID=1504668 RepID=A0A9P4M1S8_9PEZI|nr:hypothetical protein NA57DRAFT_47393 [Rhizodiscina lignyota]
MAGIPSIGDILMLSQIAWKIGRAFTAGRRGAPPEFLDIETEVNGLATSLKRLVEVLFNDDQDNGDVGTGEGLLAQADRRTRLGMATILMSCQRTLQDLDSLVTQYQDVKTFRTSGGATIKDKGWSEVVLRSYTTMMWTAEGGNIVDLRDMLHLHTSTVILTIQALQSKSLARLERTVNPMAARIDDIHNRHTGELSERMEELHRVILKIAGNQSPNIPPQRDGAESIISSMDLDGSLKSRVPSVNDVPSQPPPRHPAHNYSNSLRFPFPPQRSISDQQSPIDRQPIDHDLFSTPRDPAELPGSDPSDASSSQRLSTASSDVLGWDQPSIRQQPSRSVPGPFDKLSGTTDRRSDPTTRGSEYDSMSYDEEKEMNEKGIATRIQQEDFERSAFRNSAVLCDVRGTLVEYTQPVDPELYRLDQEIAEACTTCRICLVRKRDVLTDGAVRLSTSIWTFSDDRRIRMQQKLIDGMEIIPYASYFTPNKVSLPLPDSELIFWGTVHGGKGERTRKSSWINYVFEDAQGATHFQSLLFGRTLTHSFRTEKTLRIHEGMKGVLAYQEQLCAIELLRIWMDEVPDMHGRRGVLAMIHFSGQFRAGEGYLAFWLNSADAPVRIKDDGGRWVKVKGLRVAVEDSGVQDHDRMGSVDGEGKVGRRASDAKGGKWVTGARIEFRDEGQKMGFLEVVRSCQSARLALPDLAV